MWQGFCVLMFTVPAAGAAGEQMRTWASEDLSSSVSTLMSLVAFASPLVLLRRRWVPEVAALVALAVPLGPLMGFALPHAIRTRPSREVLRLSAMYVGGLVLWAVRDVQGVTTDSSFLRMLAADSDAPKGVPIPLNVPGVVMILVGMVLVPIGWGYYQRARGELRHTQLEVSQHQETATHLIASLDRRVEREVLAREVHDGLGHRLSLISMHAGALAVAPGDERVTASARVVQENAQRATDDLRALVTTLRDPESRSTGSYQPTVTSLSSLEGMLADLAEQGVPVTSSIFLSDADRADAVLTHSVYRIVQEVLTNARKHAPGLMVRLRVVGGPGQGISIESSNPLPGPGSSEATSAAGLRGGPSAGASGLRGMRERVGILGGTMQVTGDGGRFVVGVWLPWREGGS